MTYSIKDDFIVHGYNEKIADKVDYLLEDIVFVPGVFNFGENKEEIKMSIDGFDQLDGKVDIKEDKDVAIDFFFYNRNKEKSHYQYKDGKVRYIVSRSSGLYIIKGKIKDGKYTISYYDQQAKNYIKNKYEENGEDILLTKPKKAFKSEGISPDYTYSMIFDQNSVTDTVSSFIFGASWIDDCHSYMEGETYEPSTPPKGRKLEKKKKGKKH